MLVIAAYAPKDHVFDPFQTCSHFYKPGAKITKNYLKMTFPPYYIDINKYDLDNFTFITGSSSNHFEESKDMIGSIQNAFPTKSFYYYHLRLNNEEIEQEVNREFDAILWVDSSSRLSPKMTHSNWYFVYGIARTTNVIVQCDRIARDVFQCTARDVYRYLLADEEKLKTYEMIGANIILFYRTEIVFHKVPSIVRSISHADVLSLRQQSQFIWDTYFSSIDKIIDTTLEILKDRVDQHMSRTAFVWNTAPGALYFFPEFSQDLAAYPFFLGHLATEPSNRFTAVIYAQSTPVIVTSSIYRLIKSISRSKFLDKILILWHCDTPPPIEFHWPVPRHVSVVYKFIKSIQDRFTVFQEIDTDAVLSLDEDSYLLMDEVDFAFHVWQHFPSQLIGYIARSHYYDDGHGQWHYSSKWTNDYSMVLTASAFYHKYYGYLYSHWLSPLTRQLVDQSQNCEDILMNFLISHVTKLPPIKLTQRRYQQDSAPGVSSDHTFSLRWLSTNHFTQRQRCMNVFVEEFGYMPLIRSSMRFDPLFFKDPVSRTRKKYRQIDLIP